MQMFPSCSISGLCLMSELNRMISRVPLVVFMVEHQKRILDREKSCISHSS